MSSLVKINPFFIFLFILQVFYFRKASRNFKQNRGSIEPVCLHYLITSNLPKIKLDLKALKSYQGLNKFLLMISEELYRTNS